MESAGAVTDRGMDENPRVDPNDDTGQSLPPRPEPTAVPQAPPPGGPNSLEGVGGDGAYTTEPRDLPPSRNPAADEVVGTEAAEPEDTDTAATKGEPEPGPEQESPA